MPASKAFLRNLRRKYHLGEFAPKKKVVRGPKNKRGRGVKVSKKGRRRLISRLGFENVFV